MLEGVLTVVGVLAVFVLGMIVLGALWCLEALCHAYLYLRGKVESEPPDTPPSPRPRPHSYTWRVGYRRGRGGRGRFGARRRETFIDQRRTKRVGYHRPVDNPGEE